MRNEKGQFIKGYTSQYRGEKSSTWKGGFNKCGICQKLLHSYGAKLCVYHRSAGENNGNWTGKKTLVKNCLQCGLKFSARRDRSEKNNFCSKKCFFSSIWKGGKERFKCKDCGKQISSGSTYCVFHRFSGSRNPKWKGGKETAKVRAVISQQNREAKKKGNGGIYTLEEWEGLKKEYNYMCLCCKKYEPEIKLTVDHIIPISKGGRNDISNIQPLCFSCNTRKHTKTINYIVSNFQILR